MESNGRIVDRTFYSRCPWNELERERNRNGQKLKEPVCPSSDLYHFTIRSPLFHCLICQRVTDGTNRSFSGWTDDSSFVESLNQLLGLRQTEPEALFMDTYEQDNLIRLYKEKLAEVQQKLYESHLLESELRYKEELLSYAVSLRLLIDPKFERISGAEIMSLAKKSSDAISKGVQQASLNKQITEPPKVQQSNPKVTGWAVRTQPVKKEFEVKGFQIQPGAKLTGADLSNSELIDANLVGAKLTGANLTYSDLTGADLSNTILTDAKLTGAKLTGAKLTGVWLHGADLTGADLSNTNLNNANLVGAKLTGANLSDAKLTLANLTYSDLTGADLSNTILTNTNLSNANLANANLANANLANANLKSVNLEGANLAGATMPDGTKNP